MSFGKLLREYRDFLAREKVWWIAPIVLAVLVVGVLALAAESNAVVPHLYTLF